jgi:hypothetical protein
VDDAGGPPPAFVVDTMLGRLARWLRAMGYDTLYLRAARDRRLQEVARGENRVLVTRDVRLARLAAPRSCLISAEALEGQIAEVVARLGLMPCAEAWLSRCLECNMRLEARSREVLQGRVPPYVLATQETFMGCPGCGRTYWAGSHVERMLERLNRLLGRSTEPPGRARP